MEEGVCNEGGEEGGGTCGDDVVFEGGQGLGVRKKLGLVLGGEEELDVSEGDEFFTAQEED